MPPTKGRDYWVLDDVLPGVDAVRERCLAKDDWTEGHPYTSESWPGLRAMPGLEPAELGRIERLVRQATGAKERVQRAPGGGTLNHNCVQVVGEGRHIPGVAVPHTGASLRNEPGTLSESSGTAVKSPTTRVSPALAPAAGRVVAGRA